MVSSLDNHVGRRVYKSKCPVLSKYDDAAKYFC